MKNVFRMLLFKTLLLASASLAFGDNRNIAFYVSLSGNDSWSGKYPEPNKDKTDGPFATLEKAREAIRDSKRETGLPSGGVTVYVRGGVYSFTETFLLTEADAGTRECPIKWRAYENEEVSFIGGSRISRFESITDRSVLNRIDKDLQNKILKVDLKRQGIANYGEISSGAGLELFFQGKRMSIARYPNEEWLRIADVPQTGEKLFNEGLEREKRFDGVPVGRHFGRIKYDGDRPKRWSDENEIYCHGYWTWDWRDSYQKVKSIDPIRSEITFAEPHHSYGYTKNQRYYYLNILEELDAPGEWYLDRKQGTLYFYPPAPIDSNNTVISMFEDPIVSIKNSEFVTIQGISFEYTRGSGVTVSGGSHNLIASCEFSNLGKHAVIIDGGLENGIAGCDIYQVALAGIILKGGDRRTLTPGGNFAVNNHIHDYSHWLRTGQLAIEVSGVGNRIAHNLIHDAPHAGIYLQGNEHTVEYNEFYNLCNETGDAGALYTGRNYTWRGNTCRYNYFHHLKGPGLHGVAAIYLDDFASGFTIYGNVCYKAGRGTLIGGGRDNIVENNIYVDCFPSIVLDARGLGWASNYFDGTYRVLTETMNEMNYTEPPYSEKYPELLKLPDDEPAVPKNNKIVRNISYGGRWIELYDYYAYDFSVVTMKANLIACPDICKRLRQAPERWDPYYLNLDNEDGYAIYKFGDQRIMEEFRENMITNSDPGFIDLKNGNLQLREDSPAFELGFKRIPFEKIGLYTDEYRKTLPK